MMKRRAREASRRQLQGSRLVKNKNSVGHFFSGPENMSLNAFNTEKKNGNQRETRATWAWTRKHLETKMYRIVWNIFYYSNSAQWCGRRMWCAVSETRRREPAEQSEAAAIVSS
jgi:hypothetical protein